MRLWRNWHCGGAAVPLAGRGCRRFFLGLFAGALFSVALAAPSRGAELNQPDGVCHPVQGDGIVLSNGMVTPIGPMSPLLTGDRVIVRSGKVTIVDLRSGDRQVIAAGSEFVMPKPPTRTPDSWWLRLQGWYREIQSDSGHQRRGWIRGGSVRGGEPSFWPDGERFAPDVPPTLEWHRVCPPSALRLVQVGVDTVVVALGDSTTNTGGLPWPESFPPRSGRVCWSLLDAHGERLGGGCFEILTPAAADSARGFFLAAARDSAPAQERTLCAALLAARQRQYLW
jgi:hypothetical protein